MATNKNTTEKISLTSLVQEDADLMKKLLKQTVQEFLEVEMDACLGAGVSERSESRVGYRCGHYTRSLMTRVGSAVTCIFFVIVSHIHQKILIHAAFLMAIIG